MLSAVLHTTQRKHALSSKHMGGCPDIWGHPNVWMHPNTQHKESMICHPNIQEGCPNIWGTSKHMEGVQTYGGVKHTGAMYATICLDAPYTYTTQRKHALSDYGVSICSPYIWIPPMCVDAPCIFGFSHIFGCPLCLDAPPVCLDTPLNVWGHLKYGVSTFIGAIQTYGGNPNI